MNFTFWLLIIIGMVILWVLASSAFIAIGRKLCNKADEITNIMSTNKNDEPKEENEYEQW